jgi:hypothetical protein
MQPAFPVPPFHREWNAMLLNCHTSITPLTPAAKIIHPLSSHRQSAGATTIKNNRPTIVVPD